MKVSLIALVAGCAVASSAFGTFDLPQTVPPRLAMLDLPQTVPPRLAMLDLPQTVPPRLA